MTTTQNHRPGTRAAIDTWAAHVDAMLADADAVNAATPIATFPRDRGAAITRCAR